MVRRIGIPLALVLLLFGAILYVVRLRAEVTVLRRALAERPTAAAPSASPPGAARSVTDEQREAMLGVLHSEAGPERKVWFQVEENKPEPLAFQKALEKVFRDAGWEVATSGSEGMAFKPGIYLLVGDDEWPSYASTAYDAFQKAGIDVKAARGYRAYYEEQKKEKPNWLGPKLAADQTYVVLIGPNPPS